MISERGDDAIAAGTTTNRGNGTRTRLPATRSELVALAKADYDPTLALVADDATILAFPWPREDLAEPMIIELSRRVAATSAQGLEFLVVMTSINYRFWKVQADGSIERYRHLGKTGASALWPAFYAAWPSTARTFRQRLYADGFIQLFGSPPDVDGRAEILSELLLADSLEPICVELCADIVASGRVTVSHAATLANAFPLAFGDPYLKKAQLALSMFAGYLRSLGTDVSVIDLTAFADYQVPRVLRATGMMSYGERLAALVDTRALLPQGSREERAIRAATVLACDAIARVVGGCAADIDSLLWCSQDLAGDTPFHLTETTWY